MPKKKQLRILGEWTSWDYEQPPSNRSYETITRHIYDDDKERLVYGTVWRTIDNGIDNPNLEK